jgi:DNA invertase Pin-like site-specific DNA recombinase
VSFQEGIDTSTPMGRAMFQITAAFAELEHSIICERVQAGVDGARARGVVLGRPRKELDPDVARAALEEHGSLRKAAVALGVSVGLLRRRL